VTVAVVVLATAFNGDNDIATGVATLAGSGVTGYRAAIRWGAVTTGAIAGTAGTRLGRLGRLRVRTLRDFAIVWTLTPLVAGLAATASYLLLKG
jgi:phosphate/sulfate permease